MAWYSAHIIIATRLLKNQQSFIPVQEMVFLIEAVNHDSAEEAATKIGKEIESAGSDGITWNGEPARHEFLGIREIRSVYNVLDIDESPPAHGTELTHSYFEVSDMATAKKLARGETVEVVYASSSEYTITDW